MKSSNNFFQGSSDLSHSQSGTSLLKAKTLPNTAYHMYPNASYQHQPTLSSSGCHS